MNFPFVFVVFYFIINFKIVMFSVSMCCFFKNMIFKHDAKVNAARENKRFGQDVWQKSKVES